MTTPHLTDGAPYDEGTADWLIWSANQTATTARGRHRAVLEVLQYFAWGHLPTHLQEHSRPFGELALDLVRRLDDVPELTRALSRLLDAKDAAVRAALPRPALLQTQEA